MPKYYTGIGSRETPPEILQAMETVANWCGLEGVILRSGAADGADSAFERGCDAVQGEKEIYIPWNNFNGRSVREEGVYSRGSDQNSSAIAYTLHPVFSNLSVGAQLLHTRNVNQVLGKDSSNPELSHFLVYYAPRTRAGAVKGGTATAVKLAESHGVPCWNLWDNSDLAELRGWVNEQFERE